VGAPDQIQAGEYVATPREARESLHMGQRTFKRGHVVSAYERGVNHPSRTSLVDLVEEIDEWRGPGVSNPPWSWMACAT